MPPTSLLRATTLALLSVLLLTTFQKAHAQSAAGTATCSTTSLSGHYGLLTSGISAAGTPVTSLIHFTFDSTTATFTSVEMSSHDGVITTTPRYGTYVVNPNCTGKTTVDQSLHVAFVVTSTGFFNLNQGTGTTIEGSGVKRGSATCTNAGVKGNFGFEATGIFVTGAPVTGPVAFIGELKLSVDAAGDGVITGHVTSSENGTIFTFGEEPVTGTYSVNPDCTGTATITPEGQSALNFSFVVVDGGKRMLALETDANTVVSGRLQQ
jgi:hypothetical protein